MNGEATRVAEVTELARKFRLRAAETQDNTFRSMMLRTAGELEELAGRLLQADSGQVPDLD